MSAEPDHKRHRRSATALDRDRIDPQNETKAKEKQDGSDRSFSRIPCGGSPTVIESTEEIEHMIKENKNKIDNTNKTGL